MIGILRQHRASLWGQLPAWLAYRWPLMHLWCLMLCRNEVVAGGGQPVAAGSRGRIRRPATDQSSEPGCCCPPGEEEEGRKRWVGFSQKTFGKSFWCTLGHLVRKGLIAFITVQWLSYCHPAQILHHKDMLGGAAILSFHGLGVLVWYWYKTPRFKITRYG